MKNNKNENYQSLHYLQEGTNEEIREQLAILNSRIVGVVKLQQRRISWCNEAFARLFGYTSEELKGQSIQTLCPNDNAYKIFWSAADRATAQGKIVRIQLQLMHKNGTLEWYEASGERFESHRDESIWSLINISEHKRLENKIQQLAFCDALTNLPNRRMLNDRLKQALSFSKRTLKYGALMMLDLDHFKQINDTLGHDSGDCLLIEVGKRLKAIVREEDTVARIGGDEFIVLIAGLHEDAPQARLNAEFIAEKIRLALAAPYENCRNQEAGSPKGLAKSWCTASIGVVMFPQNLNGYDEYLKSADAAMYAAKRAGGNRVNFNCGHTDPSNKQIEIASK